MRTTFGFVLGLFISFSTVHASGQPVLMPGTYEVMGAGPQAVLEANRARLGDIGYRLSPSDLSASYFLKEDIRSTFTAAEPMRGRIPAGRMLAAFRPITAKVLSLIEGGAAPDTERRNEISNAYLAAKIVRLAFCFGTDPYAVTEQIRAESRFDQTQVSPTGAVGLTQMTSIAIDEVNDQLGNRAKTGANVANFPYLRGAISCYLGTTDFHAMFESGVFSQGKTINGNWGLSSRAKAWLRADIDRQLIYGQIALKIYLALARDAGLEGRAAYTEAMRNYNGDRKGGHDRAYSRGIMTRLDTI